MPLLLGSLEESHPSETEGVGVRLESQVGVGAGGGLSLKGLFILRALEPQGPEKIKLVLQRPLSQTWEPGGLAFRGETGGEGI